MDEQKSQALVDLFKRIGDKETVVKEICTDDLAVSTMAAAYQVVCALHATSDNLMLTIFDAGVRIGIALALIRQDNAPFIE